MDARRQVGLFHPGVQYSWQTALALQQLDALAFYATTIFYRPERWPYRLERWLPGPLARRLHAEFARFDGPPLDPARLHTFGTGEWLERIARRAGWERSAQRLDRWGNRRFAGGVRRLLAATRPPVTWAYGGTAREVFEGREAAGRRRVLDRSIGDWRAYRAAIAPALAAYPEFALPERTAVRDATLARDDAEYAAADVILLGCAFAADTVRRHAPAAASKVRVLPYCFDEALFATPAAPREHRGPVRFLFLGQVGMRKGVHLLLKVMERLPASAASLTIIGDLQLPPATWARYADRVTHHRTVPRHAVPAVMAAHDVLVLPSYFEGSAVTLLEALASGMALVQSAGAGNGATPATGLVLAALSEAALAAAMLTLIDDRPRLAAMQAAAPAEAERYTFARYRDNIGALLDELTAPPPRAPPPPVR